MKSACAYGALGGGEFNEGAPTFGTVAGRRLASRGFKEVRVDDATTDRRRLAVLIIIHPPSHSRLPSFDVIPSPYREQTLYTRSI